MQLVFLATFAFELEHRAIAIRAAEINGAVDVSFLIHHERDARAFVWRATRRRTHAEALQRFQFSVLLVERKHGAPIIFAAEPSGAEELAGRQKRHAAIRLVAVRGAGLAA